MMGFYFSLFSAWCWLGNGHTVKNLAIVIVSHFTAIDRGTSLWRWVILGSEKVVWHSQASIWLKLESLLAHYCSYGLSLIKKLTVSYYKSFLVVSWLFIGLLLSYDLGSAVFMQALCTFVQDFACIGACTSRWSQCAGISNGLPTITAHNLKNIPFVKINLDNPSIIHYINILNFNGNAT